MALLEAKILSVSSGNRNPVPGGFWDLENGGFGPPKWHFWRAKMALLEAKILSVSSGNRNPAGMAISGWFLVPEPTVLAGQNGTFGGQNPIGFFGNPKPPRNGSFEAKNAIFIEKMQKN